MFKKGLCALLLSLYFLPLICFGEKEQDIYAYDKAGNVGVNPLSPGSGNVQREVLDLQTFGNAPVEFKRFYRSRYRNYIGKAWELGVANTWQHNWAWELKDVESKHNGFLDIRLNTPEGESVEFWATDNTGMLRAPGPSRGDRLYQWKPKGELKNGQTLITPEGWEYYFERRPHPNYALVAVRDPDGQMWELEYDNQNRLTKIQNRFGRFISIERGEVNDLERITKVKSSDGREVHYDYGTFKANTVIKSVNYPGGEKANYTYVGGTSLTEGRPLLETADDPMLEGAGAHIRWVYNYQPKFGAGRDYMVVGMAKEERNLLTDELVVSLPLGAGSESWVVEGDDTGTYRKFYKGLLVERVDGEGRWEKIFYGQGGFGYISKRLYPNGAEINYERDAHGRITKQTDPLGNSRSYTYNANGFLLTSTDEDGHITTIERNAEDLPIKKIYPNGASESWTYNSDNQVLTHTARNNGITTYVYYNGEPGGQYGDLKAVTDALGNITSYTYDAAGNLISQTDALNRKTTYSYNARGKLLTVTYPDNSQIVKVYDTYGNLIKDQNELGFITSYTHDEYNRLETVTDSEGGVTTYQYGKAPDCGSCSAAQTISKIIDPEGRETHYFYDKSGNRTQQILGANTPQAALTVYQYDSVNDLTAITDPNGSKTTQVEDLNHRLLSRTDPLGNTTSYTYDKAGNLKTETRANGTVIAYDYDTMDRLIKTIDAENQITQMTYDASDNLEKLIDAKNNIYTYTYDLLNRKKSLVYPNNSKESWDYNKVGNLQVYTARNGQTRTCTYDLRDRELTCDWSDNTTDSIKTYDLVGRLLTLNNPNSQLAYTYDKANRLLSETQVILNSPLIPQVSTHTYDKSGLRKTLTYPDGTLLSYAYTTRKELKTISKNQQLLVTYSYDKGGNRLTKSLTPNDFTQVATYDYDPANQLKQIQYTTNGEKQNQINYSHNTVGNITNRNQVSKLLHSTVSYQYDKTDQIKEAFYNEGKHKVNYQWDKVGNRTQVTDTDLAQPIPYQANALNQYTFINQQVPTYDANGNLSKLNQSSFTYDSDNKLLSAQKGNTNLIIKYDARRRAVSRILNGQATYLVYDNWNLLAEYNAKGQLTANYIHGSNIDELISRTQNGVTYYYSQDSLGNVTHLTNEKGLVVESYQYDAFGQPTIFNAQGQPIKVSSWRNRFLFTGREWIKEVSLYDYRNRVYSPELGRFLQTDPIGFWNNMGAQGVQCWKQAKFNPKFADVDHVNLHQEENGWEQMKSNPKFTRLEDINLYRYVKNNPINLIDPQGTSSIPGKLCRVACVAVGALAGAGCTGDAWEIALCWAAVAGLVQLCTESCPY